MLALDFARVKTGAIPRATTVALVPMRHGRVLVGGLRRWVIPEDDPIPEAMVDALGRAYAVTWAPTVDRALLARACGDGPCGWRSRSLDIRRLAPAADETREDAGEVPSYELVEVARRCHVPVPQPLGVVDGALVIAELFLVLATRLEVSGCRSVRALLRTGAYGS